MAKGWLEISALVLIVSLCSSYSNTYCEPISDPRNFASTQELTNVWNSLSRGIYPFANVISTKSYEKDKSLCTSFFMNVFDISTQWKYLLNKKIIPSYNAIVDELANKGFLRPFKIDSKSMMFEPSRKRIAFVDFIRVFESDEEKVSEKRFKEIMGQRLQDLIDTMEKEQPSQNGNELDDLPKELGEINKQNESNLPHEQLTFLTEGFEKQYSVSNSDPRSKIRKMVDKFSVGGGEALSPSLKIITKPENGLMKMDVYVDTNLNQKITFNETNAAVSVFVCRYYPDKYKECVLVDNYNNRDETQKVIEIPKGQRIDVDVYSKPLEASRSYFHFLEHNFYQNNPMYAKDLKIYFSHEIYLIIVPEETPGIVSNRLALNTLLSENKKNKFYICIDEESQLKLKKNPYEAVSEFSVIKMGKVSGAIKRPEGIDLIQVPFYMRTENGCHSPTWKKDVYFIVFEEASILTFVNKDNVDNAEPGLYVFAPEYHSMNKVLKQCVNPIDGLFLFNVKEYNLVKFGERSVRYPTKIMFAKLFDEYQDLEFCIRLQDKTNFYTSVEKIESLEFKWVFNSHKWLAITMTSENYLYLSKITDDKFIFPFTNFEFPATNKNFIYISVVKVIDPKPNDPTVFKIQMILANNENTYLDVFSKTQIESQKKQKSEEGEDINIAKLNLKIFPTKFVIIDKGNKSIEIILNNGVVTYLSEKEAIYTFEQSVNKECDFLYNEETEKLAEANSSGIVTVNCKDKGTLKKLAGTEKTPVATSLSTGLLRIKKRTSIVRLEKKVRALI